MFAGSISLLDDCGLTFLHVFPFSPRPGTPAARMPQVARATIKERAARLRVKGEGALAGHLKSKVGSEVELLMEHDRLGRTPGFIEMMLAEPASDHQVLRARVTGSTGRRLYGEQLAPTCVS
jgi:threonylcarbamoyladenosine tRNA methylthiotransferase MtaB